MIASVNGEVIDIALDHVVIEAAGVGYRVNATPATLSTLRRGTQVRLITAMIVREDSMTLYGFTDTDARDLFLTLLGVSGVGPKIAMATLAVYDAPTLRQALADGDVNALTRVPGIGKRGAERLVLELREKVAAAGAQGGTTELGRGTASLVRTQVVEALIGLGFAAKQAEQTTDTVLAQDDSDGDTSTVLRSALTLLGKTR
ncbi:Holliday junction branch migration protein RuvA [Mycobacteroides salmoniphilum]|uniref:Holliday junction branch migration complex subunit RuvA n=1 Tax=Mycobacteroides salmoniphilum TaxID=404941 RepID=A0A4R8SA01_9MYCO|nr:Holliday junction branch migration protein RuvA [Mycobacteroides salmoniphilum]TDZ89975.1 Holliday junction ATP-dependent DNA helicase RuvA [Mycobacteroides salmoniphilum]TDZ99940.1 Holliday junction ATP-dependent DNA helicase RuvA [Mycobacteroides salmoniphilum]